MKTNKLLVVCGPTAVGKSSLAVDIAKKHDSEVVSADSRQVYKGLDIASGKITDKQKQGVPHHLLDVADPDERFSVHDYKEIADKRIQEIHERNHLPILCGGTGFYIQAIVDDIAFPDVPRNEKLRKKLQERSTESLYKELKEKDSRRANEIDENNPVRLIRALEIVEALGEVPKLEKNKRFDTMQIGLDLPDKKLKKRIITRTKKRFDRGIIEEVKQLHENGLSLERMRALGFEYEHLADYIDDQLNQQKLFEMIVRSDWKYAKKQQTWFQKDDRIQWFNPATDKKELKRVIKNFIQ